MLTRICDICKKDVCENMRKEISKINKDLKTYPWETPQKTPRLREWDCVMFWHEIDICDKCFEKLQQFIKKEEGK